MAEPCAQAQSAPADVASARKLAQEGVVLYDSGRYSDALDRMQRAESLFDAPVHLLYIARCQRKLSQLVEASETYRKLTRVTVEPSASAAFKEAVEAGKRELAEVEAQLGELRIDVEPAGVAGLTLSIDGRPVPAAAVGVERPTNPGSHRVRAEAPGYAPVEANVDLKDGEKRALRLALIKTGDVAPPPAQLAPGAAAATPSNKRFSFFVGLRFGGVIPAGNLFRVDGQQVAASDYFAGGGMAELHGGIRYARYFALKLYLEGYAMGAGSWLNDQADAQNALSGEGFGIGVMVGTPPREWGGFGEIGLTAFRTDARAACVRGLRPALRRPHASALDAWRRVSDRRWCAHSGPPADPAHSLHACEFWAVF
ncbi:MAG: PEGA domain-containing protein [Polyangiaceae bacterium]